MYRSCFMTCQSSTITRTQLSNIMLLPADAKMDRTPVDEKRDAFVGPEQTIAFRCPPELEPVLPRPIPAVLGLPDWFKAMPQKAINSVTQGEQFTVKKCPPFIDAMTYGFLMPLVA